MKKISLAPGRLLAILSALLLLIFWAVWFFCYPNFLIWLEGYSYFSTLPDFTSLYGSIPEGIPGYIGAFLHQFYKWPALGALIQAFFAVWPVVCAGVIVIRIFEEPKGLLWIAFLVLPIYIYRQFWDLLIYFGVIFSAVATVLMLLVLVAAAIWKPSLKMPEFLKNRWLNMVVMLASVICSVYFLTGLDPRNRRQEEITRLENLGQNGQWQEILSLVTPKDAKQDQLKSRYALLALAETGYLTEYAFRYGLSGLDSFLFYDTPDPLCLNFNALFYQCMDMHNAVIQQSYQQGVQSVPGIGFASLRRLADTYLELKDYELARKYLDILAHSTCHGAWVKERLPKLESIKGEEPAYQYDEHKALIADFPHTISSMVDRNVENRKYTDLLLCAYLANEDGDKFLNILRYIAPYQYPEGTPLPRLYEEAVILISMVDPSVLQEFVISEQTRARFADYVSMMNTGRGTQALKKYADTYWAYSY